MFLKGEEPLQQIYGELEKSYTTPKPLIECFLPDNKKSNSIGLIVFPGGGYGNLAAHEGKGYADYFAKQGIASFVVSYRLGTAGYRHPAMLEDGLAAIKTVRESAEQFGIDANKLGVIGSSAGGHLAVTVLTQYQNYESSINLRPDFGILCYPVVTMKSPHTHMGSRKNLLGDAPSDFLIEQCSGELCVTAATPPCFIWHTVEDKSVPVDNSQLLVAALKNSGIAYEAHFYEKGRHGLGLNAKFDWGSESIRWIKERYGE